MNIYSNQERIIRNYLIRIIKDNNLHHKLISLIKTQIIQKDYKNRNLFKLHNLKQMILISRVECEKLKLLLLLLLLFLLPFLYIWCIKNDKSNKKNNYNKN